MEWQHPSSKTVRRVLLLLLVLVLCFVLSPKLPGENEPTQVASSRAMLLTVAGAIGPATSDYIQHGIRKAHERGDRLVILKLDTPGGLDSSMRAIIRAIIASPVPVVTYVAPSGSRAASAGTYILYASHIAAMAPATNLGAATPVQIGGLPKMPSPEPARRNGNDDGDGAKDNAQEDADDSTPGRPADAMTKKMTNDAVAYIRGLALLRGRNEEWAEEAVREAASLTSEDALAANVIDLIVRNESALLEQLNGFEVVINGNPYALSTEQMVLDPVAPGWRTELLAVIASPNVAYILMLFGIYGLFFELANPGAIVPGVTGVICLLFAMFALQMLPVNYAGLALVLLGIAFMIGEVFVPSFGALGIGGVAAFAIGSLILFDTDSEHFRVSLSIIVALTILTSAFFLLAIRSLIAARRGPVVSGREQLVGEFGQALEDFDSSGQIRVHGEIWKADTERPVHDGERVQVTAIDGLTLHIEPHEEKDP
jgi:membrane-bound serine protease (ClpP class)